MLRRTAILILYLVLASLGRCPAQQYLFSHLSDRDGLLGNNIQAVQQDSLGFIWIATANGIQRYDGQRFKSFKHRADDPSSLPDAVITGIQMDKKNRLWIQTNKKIIGYLDISTFTFQEIPIHYNDSILKKSGAGLYVDRSGNVMYILVGHAILTFSESKRNFSPSNNVVPLPPGWRPIYVWQDHNNNYWIGAHQGLAKYNPGKKILSYNGHNQENDKAIEQFRDVRTVIFAYHDKSGRFWVTSWPSSGMFIRSFDVKSGEIKEWQGIIGAALHNKYYELHGITETSGGTLWMAGHNLFARYANDRIDIIPSDMPGEFSIRYDGIHHLFEDREKNIWVSTSKGLFRFNPTAQLFKPVSNRFYGTDSVATPDVTDFLHTSKGEIIVSTWGSGMFAYDKDFNPIPNKYAQQGLPGEIMVWCMHQTKNGDIWRGIQDGYLFIYHAASKTIEKKRPPEFGNSTIRQVTEDPAGNLWFGTQKGAVIKWNASTNSFKEIFKTQSVITRMYTDRKGFVWACTDNNGIYRFNAPGETLVASFKYNAEKGKGLLIYGATDIVQYDDSSFVIASDGLAFLNIYTGRFWYHNAEKGLPCTDISNLVLDSRGYIWMSCVTGILSYHPLKRKLSIYTSLDGLHTTAFNIGTGTLLKDGRIVLGTTHDFIVFQPDKVTVSDYIPPRVLLTGINIMNEPLNLDSITRLNELELKYNEYSLSIQFSTLNFQNTYGIYSRLKGLEEEWLISENNQVTYNYLRPGTYTLQLACRNADGAIGQVTELIIEVKSPFWKTWWFYCSVILLVSGILYLVDRQRTIRKNREQKIRADIAANLHEEVNTTLQNINVLSEIAGMKADKHPEQTKDYIYEVKEKSRNMVTAMNDVLWSIDPSNDSMPKTIDRMEEIAESMRNRYSTNLVVQIDPAVRKLQLDMKTRHEFMTIYKLAIVTLVELLNASQTTIQLDYIKGCIYLKVFSTASQITRASNNVLRNLREMKHRAESIKARLDIQSDQNATGMVLSIKI